MFLTRISVRHPVFATMLMLALVVIGVFSYQRLAVEQFPDIDFPVVVVQTGYAGASPETVEAELTRPIEEAVNTATGLDTLSSRSYRGQSVVIAQFDLSVDSGEAAQDVRDKVAAIEGSLPETADRPQVLRFDPSEMPIMSIAISSGTLPLRDLTRLAEGTIVDRLTTIPGVGRATLVGGVPRQIEILVDEARLRSLGVGVDEVLNAVRAENQDVPAGAITRGLTERTIEVEGRIDDPAAFLDIIVARRGGRPIYLGEVATVVDGQAEAEGRALLDGEPALAIDVVKVQGANTIAVADGIRRAVAELEGGVLPAGVDLVIVRDDSRSIRASVDSVQRTVVEGAVLAVLIVFLFLNSWRSTVITGLTLPVSVIGTFTVLYFLGFTLNMMTLLALSLAIGILIDDAIVVRENITRHLHMGKTHRRAALEGTGEIGLAVLATTLSIVAVFLPVAFMGGIIGRFFLQFGVTVSVAVLISLFVSFTLDPMLSSVWYDPASVPGARRGPVGRLVDRFGAGFDRLGQGYRAVLGWALRHRVLTLAAAALLFVGSLALVPVVGVEFVPQGDEGEFQVDFETPVGASVDYTAAKARQVEGVLQTFPEILSTYATVNAGTANGTNQASIHVNLVPLEERARSPQALAPLVRERLAPIAGIEAAVGLPGLGGMDKPIQVTVMGDDIATLDRLAGQVADIVRAVPGATDVEQSLDEAQPTLEVRIKRDVASDLGVSLQQIGLAVRPLVAGEAVTNWNAPDGEVYDVVVRLPEAVRNDPAALAALPIVIATESGPVTVRLDQVAEITSGVGASEIVRQDLRREVTVSANVAGRTAGEVVQDVTAALDGLALPPGYRLSFGGEAENLGETAGNAGAALVLAVLFIYFVLASQFGSFLQPLAIMMSLPLSLIGVLAGLFVTGSTLNMMSVIGFIMLMGLVVKNAILLVDFSNQRRAEGASLPQSLLAAGTTRFRPIVMTTLAMIFGMLPLALGLGEGSGQSAPMAHAVIGGLVSSTLLTLVVTPVILTYLDAFGRRARRFFPKAPDEAEDAADDRPRAVRPRPAMRTVG